VWLIIPAYNVEPWLEELLRRSSSYIPLSRTIVVDDGSTDGTAQIAQRSGALLARHIFNQGKGKALKTGFEYVLGKGALWCITMDGDLQHPPEVIPKFLEAAATNVCDLIIGSRDFHSKGMPWDRRFSNWSTSKLLSRVTGQRIHDAQSGYRMIRTDLLKKVDLSSRRYDFETEMLLRLSRLHARFQWIQIPTIYNQSQSSINRLGDTLRFIKVVSKFLVAK
jgi:glycosyltransferase involved in cell wall biosynthesis